MTSDLADYLPISMLNQLEYCERRFYLMHVLGEMEVNAHVLEGSLRHAQAHTGRMARQGELLVHRRVYVWSDELRVAGFADVIEESGRESPNLIPVEYKKGRMGRWLNDHVQLCAQAICLEERLGISIPQGQLFYFGSRRREEVAFTEQLRQETHAAVDRARRLVDAGQLPDPLTTFAKCRDCSLEPVCLPRETLRLAGAGPLQPGG